MLRALYVCVFVMDVAVLVGLNRTQIPQREICARVYGFSPWGTTADLVIIHQNERKSTHTHTDTRKSYDDSSLKAAATFSEQISLQTKVFPNNLLRLLVCARVCCFKYIVLQVFDRKKKLLFDGHAFDWLCLRWAFCMVFLYDRPFTLPPFPSFIRIISRLPCEQMSNEMLDRVVYPGRISFNGHRLVCRRFWLSAKCSFHTLLGLFDAIHFSVLFFFFFTLSFLFRLFSLALSFHMFSYRA